MSQFGEISLSMVIVWNPLYSQGFDRFRRFGGEILVTGFFLQQCICLFLITLREHLENNDALSSIK